MIDDDSPSKRTVDALSRSPARVRRAAKASRREAMQAFVVSGCLRADRRKQALEIAASAPFIDRPQSISYASKM